MVRPFGSYPWLPPLITSSVTKSSCSVADLMNLRWGQSCRFLFHHNLQGTMKCEAGVCQRLCEKILWQLTAKKPSEKSRYRGVKHSKQKNRKRAWRASRWVCRDIHTQMLVYLYSTEGNTDAQHAHKIPLCTYNTQAQKPKHTRAHSLIKMWQRLSNK